MHDSKLHALIQLCDMLKIKMQTNISQSRKWNILLGEDSPKPSSFAASRQDQIFFAGYATACAARRSGEFNSSKEQSAAL